MRHTIMTIITEINPSKRLVLEQILGEIRLDLLRNPFIPFSSLSLLHFASFVISDDKKMPPLLIFENNFDGDVSSYLDELIIHAGDGIDWIYQCCTDYIPSTRNQNLKTFLLANVVRPSAFHIGNVGRAAKDIAENQKLRERLQLYLDQLFQKVRPESFSPFQLRKNLQKFVRTHVPPDLSKPLPPHQTATDKLIPKARKGLFFFVAGVLTLMLLPIVIILIFMLRYKENRDPVEVQSPSVSEIEELIKTENQITQNRLANITTIKPGSFRLILLKVVLFATNLLARTSTKGKLSDIPSIHFSHWSIINKGTQLLFLSNYDGSWSSYLDDFIDKASPGLTGIWSNTQGFPSTRFLILDGARDELPFKAFARNHQVQSLVWYSAYRDLTVQNIDKDSLIREDIFTSLSEAQTQECVLSCYSFTLKQKTDESKREKSYCKKSETLRKTKRCGKEEDCS
ncbi:hypothetical protein [Dyadobacter frigoris]|uniref:Uncharacterized protein n=1 Tax=Dyadobacter frigoris TaxID=2576211 RepID=A0A4U6CLZ0_9BACT|nr:hypothetical protein [Dyadobacter frigoris]TKT85310.1 hypothetical protein FDK13_33920 [Dyadobacter frigoris]